ncbi:MAG TPA: hypothetical protein VG125_15210 [Pirellulales bacterium]|nr:hypothetical protein [Pirellulales bacterium]
MNRLLFRRWVRIGTLTAALLCAAQTAHPASTPADDLTSLPPQRPVKVTMSVDLLEVSQIQDHEEKFEIEFYLFITWKDERLAFEADEGHKKRIVPADQIWTPEPELADDLDVTVQNGRNAHIHPDGTVMWRQYYRGTLSSNFDLHEFPFDSHRLEIHVEANAGEIDDIVYVAGGCQIHEEQASEAYHVVPHGWELVDLSTAADEAKYPRLGETFSRFVCRIGVKRDPHFYWWAIVLPLLPIVATSWSVFWMDPKEFSSQVGVGVTAMLTVVAYRITIDSSLPPLSYMTRMDYFLLVCQAWVFGAFLMSVVVHVCHVQGSEKWVAISYRISQYCRWLPPLALLATCSLLAFLRPGAAMAILGAAVIGLFLACRPTPGRVAQWVRVALFPERVLERPGSPAATEKRGTLKEAATNPH